MPRLIRLVCALLAAACVLPAQEAPQPRIVPGPQPDQSILLPNSLLFTNPITIGKPKSDEG